MKTYFRSKTVYNQTLSNIDRENGIIKGITLCQVGEARGHDLFLDEQFIDKVVMLGNENKAGIKARFGHPNICSTALGTYLGRYKNFRREGNTAVADLYLDQTAKTSPNGNLFDYVLNLAESNPDMFGASIAFKAGKAEKRLETVNDQEVEKNFATILSLYAADMVDDPAATNGLFESGVPELAEGPFPKLAEGVAELVEGPFPELVEGDFAFQASLFLDEHPEIYDLLNKKPEIVEEFLTNYNSFKQRSPKSGNAPDTELVEVQCPEPVEGSIKQATPFSFLDEISKLRKWVSDNFSVKKSQADNPNPDVLKTQFESRIAELESKFNNHENIDSISKEIEIQLENALRINTHHNLAINNYNTDDNSGILQLITEVLIKTDSLLNTQKETIAQLQSELNKSKAFPTLPDKKGDPKLNIKQRTANDDTGKVLLENLPDTIKRKLKTQSQNP